MRARAGEARVARLATVTADGAPHIVPCCFTLTGDTIWSAVDQKPKSTLALRRLDNLRRHPRVSLLVDHYEEDWAELWWVRIDGDARVVVDDDERERALDRLAAKYVHYVEHRPQGAVIAITITAWRFWP